MLILMYTYSYFYYDQVELDTKSNVTTCPKSGVSCDRSRGKLVQSIFDGRITVNTINQSVENAAVAFVKGANERNEFFEKINKL